MAGKRGIKKIDQFEVGTLSGNEVVQIYLDTRRSPTVFFASLGGEKFENTDMNAVEYAVRQKAETLLRTAFSPYIEFEATGVSDGNRLIGGYSIGRDGVSLRFQAIAVSPLIQGNRYEIPADIDDDGEFHLFANQPRPRNASLTKRLVPFTRERWAKFEQIKAVIEQARARLAGVLSGDEEQVARTLDSGATATKLLGGKGD